MTNDIRRFIPFFDPSASQWAAEARWLRWLTFLWLFVGLTALFSASYPIANSEFGDGLYYFKRQLIAVAIGLAGFNLMVYSPLRYLLKTAQLGVLVLLGLLWLTLVPGVGTTINGATRWISLGPVPIIQPSELIKPFFVLQSARIFGNWPRLTNKVRFTWLGIFGAMLLGILLQPNLSTTALCGMTLWLVALAAGLPYLQLGATAMGGMLLAVLVLVLGNISAAGLCLFSILGRIRCKTAIS